MTTRELKVSAIRNGTVIDHIAAGTAFTVVKILHLDQTKETVTIASNVPSGITGKKDIVKIEHRALSPEEVSSIALISPTATVNIIEEYEVVEKSVVSLPDTIERIVRCSNPLCISNHEEIHTCFNVEQKSPLVIRCYYCERTMGGKDVLKVLG